MGTLVVAKALLHLGEVGQEVWGGLGGPGGPFGSAPMWGKGGPG